MCDLVCKWINEEWVCEWECQRDQTGTNGIAQIVIGKEDTTITNAKPPLRWRAAVVPTQNGNELHLIPPDPITTGKWSFRFETNDTDVRDFVWDTREAVTRKILEQSKIKVERYE
jgi:hypothetical protein